MQEPQISATDDLQEYEEYEEHPVSNEVINDMKKEEELFRGICLMDEMMIEPMAEQPVATPPQSSKNKNGGRHTYEELEKMRKAMNESFANVEHNALHCQKKSQNLSQKRTLVRSIVTPAAPERPNEEEFTLRAQGMLCPIPIFGEMSAEYEEADMPPMHKRRNGMAKLTVRFSSEPPPTEELLHTLTETLLNDPMYCLRKNSLRVPADMVKEEESIVVSMGEYQGMKFIDLCFATGTMAIAHKKIKTMSVKVANTTYQLNYRTAGWCHLFGDMTCYLYPENDNHEVDQRMDTQQFTRVLEAFGEKFADHIRIIGAWRRGSLLRTKEFVPLAFVEVLIEVKEGFSQFKVPAYLNSKGQFTEAKQRMDEGVEWYRFKHAYDEFWCRTCKNGWHNMMDCTFTVCRTCGHQGHTAYECTDRIYRGIRRSRTNEDEGPRKRRYQENWTMSST